MKDFKNSGTYHGNYLKNIDVKSGDKIRTLMIKVDKAIGDNSGGGGSEPGPGEGEYYIKVYGNKTPTENGTELETAYATAKAMSPAAGNEVTIVVYPGEYGLSGKLILDTSYINIVSLTGNRDVILDRADVVGDPFEFTPPSTMETSDVLLIDADYVYVKGMVGKLRNSSNFVPIGGTSDYILPIQVGDNLPNIVVENCVGGLGSFGGDMTRSNPIEVSGTFKDCTGGQVSFGGGGTASGTFINCTSGSSSFGTGGTASGTFINCTGGQVSFGGGNGGTASGTFKDCTGGQGSFGGIGVLDGTLINCRLTSGTFQTVTAPGRTYFCIDGNGDVDNQ